MFYFQAVSRKVYASVISIVDGVAGIIPLAILLSSMFGINGLWWSFTVLSALMLIGILVINLCIAGRSGGRYRGVMLIENEDSDIPVFDVTVPIRENEISDAAKKLQDFCTENISERKTSMIMALALEEMLSFTLDHTGGEISMAEADVLVKILPDHIIMDIRSIGKPLDPGSAPAEDYSNVDVLRKIARSIEYNYVMGMNQTRIRTEQGA